MMSDYIHLTVAGSAAVVGGVFAIIWYLTRETKPAKIIPPIDLKNQTVQLSNAEHDRVSVLLPDAQLRRTPFHDVYTVYDAFRRGMRVSDNGRCLGRRDGEDYEWITYREVIEYAQCLAATMTAKGLLADQMCRIGIFAKNCPEWVIAEQACHVNARVIVPLYDTFGYDAVMHIVNLCKIRLIICDEDEKALALLKHEDNLDAASGRSGIRHLIMISDPSEALVEFAAGKADVDVMTFEGAIDLGHEIIEDQGGVEETPPLPTDTCTICFTSGTTGTPKGVVMTHASVVAATTVLSTLKNVHLDNRDVIISYLPLAHSLERLLETVMFSVGGRVGFYSGDVRKLSDDMRVLRPSVVPAVPRLLNRVYDRVMSEVGSSWFKRKLFEMAMAAKVNEVENFIIRHNSFWDKVAFRRIRNGFGGRCRLLASGSAPLSPHVLNFFRASMGCVVLEGYGQTETSGCSNVTVEGDPRPGHVGPPIPCCKIKLVDVPDMDYFAGEDKGEIVIKGYNIFAGYFGDEERTREALDEEGWLHTGDIGQWTDQGSLKIIDRKKHLFKLAQGEYIAPERIENVYVRSPLIAQVFVYGNSFKYKKEVSQLFQSCLIGVVIPDFDEVRKNKKELAKKTDEEITSSEAAKKSIMENMGKIAKEAGLKGFEQLRKIHLDSTPWSVENDMLTPTFKAKRPSIQKHYAKILESMYLDLD